MDRAAASGAPSWGAAATDHGPTMLSFAGPSSSSAAAAAEDISEARLQDFAAGLAQRSRPAGAAGAGRRSRSGAGGSEACSVDGCRSDLSRCRDYHRRHRVCEAHSKTPVVVVAGQEQRFCQQCSRFHMLSEFDEGKRSCRKRLDGHNRRRRKPQHDLSNLGGFFPYHQVNQFETARQSFDAMYLVDRQPSFSISFSRTPKQFPFPQDGGGMLSASRHGHFLVEDSSHSISSACNNDLSGTLGPECALSLLSSSLHHPSSTGQAQVSSALSRIASASQQVATTAVTTAFASGGSHHVFGPDAVLEDPSQTLPFPWQ